MKYLLSVAFVLLVYGISFLATSGLLWLVLTYFLPIFGITVAFSWSLAIGVYAAIIILKAIFGK